MLVFHFRILKQNILILVCIKKKTILERQDTRDTRISNFTQGGQAFYSMEGTVERRAFTNVKNHAFRLSTYIRGRTRRLYPVQLSKVPRLGNCTQSIKMVRQN
jgi:hypothetical protein